MTSLQASDPTSLHAPAVQSLLVPLVDILLLLLATVSSVALCIDFMNWTGRPLDSAGGPAQKCAKELTAEAGCFRLYAEDQRSEIPFAVAI